MIIINDNILKVKKGIICHQVNCMGKMGAGLALDIRKKWQIVYKDYIKSFKNKELFLGNVILSEIIDSQLYVASLCGQLRYGRKGQYTNYRAVEKCLKKVKEINNYLKLPIYIPEKMGCSLAGGNWSIVCKIVEEIIPNVIIMKKE